MQQTVVGFYWTRPVNWAGFRTLPRDAGAAAEASRIIRYQMERARGWVDREGLRLSDEVVFMDTRTDRATDGCKDALLEARRKCPDRKPLLLYVAFDEVSLWRHNPHIKEAAAGMGFEAVPLSPDPIMIQGHLFDPIEHFRRWRRLDEISKAEIRQTAAIELERAEAAFPHGDGRYGQIADTLNREGVRTVRGIPWTDESVRKALSRRGTRPDTD
jgi:hypothetical protein